MTVQPHRKAPFFRVRSAARDRTTDAARFDRLLAAAERCEREAEAERTGFAARHEATAASAAFAQSYVEDGRADGLAALSDRIDDLTGTMKAYRDRMTALDGQIRLFRRIRQLIESRMLGKP